MSRWKRLRLLLSLCSDRKYHLVSRQSVAKLSYNYGEGEGGGREGSRSPSANVWCTFNVFLYFYYCFYYYSFLYYFPSLFLTRPLSVYPQFSLFLLSLSHYFFLCFSFFVYPSLSFFMLLFSCLLNHVIPFFPSLPKDISSPILPLYTIISLPLFLLLPILPFCAFFHLSRSLIPSVFQSFYFSIYLLAFLLNLPVFYSYILIV